MSPTDIDVETVSTQERAVWLRIITIIGCIVLVLFGVLIIAVLSGGDNLTNESIFSLDNLFVIDIMVILPITTGLFLLIVFGFRKKIYAIRPMIETVLTIATGCVWIISGLFTAAVSIRNLSDGRSAAAPVILIIVSAGAIAGAFFLMKRMLGKRAPELTGGKA